MRDASGGTGRCRYRKKWGVRQPQAEKVRLQREKRERWRAAGVCPACGGPCARKEGRWMEAAQRFESVKLSMCRRHLNMLASQQRRFHRRKRTAA